MHCTSAVFVILLFAGLNLPARADFPDLGPLIPGDNSDLQQIISNAQAIELFSADCGSEFECPEMDCFTARTLRGTLLNMRNNLLAMNYWMKLASDAHMAHFESLAEQGILSGEQLAQLQEIMAWQGYVMGIANAMLDIADIADIVTGFINDPSKLNPQNIEEFVNHAWKLDKLIKKTESLASNVGTGGAGGATPYAGLTPDAFGLEGSDWNTVKGYTGELLGGLTAMQQNMDLLKGAKGLTKGEKLWKAFNGFTSKNTPGVNILKDQAGARANLLSALGSIVSAWGASDLKDRAARAQELYLDQVASDIVQTKAFDALQKVNSRRWMVEDALAAVKQAMAAFDACASKYCPLASISPTNIPDFIDVSPDQTISIESWGRALRYFNNKLQELTPLMLNLPEIWDNCPETDSAGTYGFPWGDGESGVNILIGTDSPTWCTYGDGNPTTVIPDDDDGDDPRDVTPPGGDGGDDDDGDDPRDVTPPGGDGGDDDDGDDPRDVTPCEQELKLLNDFMASDEGTDLRQTARTNAQDAHDLKEINDRMAELEKECGDGADPRDVGEPAGSTTPPIAIPTGDDDGEDPRDTGEPTIVIYVKATSSAMQQENRTIAGQQIKLFVVATTDVALPGEGVDKPQTDHNQEPIQGTTDGNGNVVLLVPGSAIGLKVTPTAGAPVVEIAIDTTAQSSVNAQLANGDTQTAVNSLPAGLGALLSDVNVVNGIGFLTFTFPVSMTDSVQRVLIHIPGVITIEINYCRDKQGGPNDPLYQGNRAWKQKYDNQWAIKRIGLTDGPDSAWNQHGDNPKPVVVAVIDTGLDWNHLDIDWNNIWSNPGETPGNGVDDDRNGYVDDIIGWDFFAGNNKPWDHDGHGTFIAGLIAATSNNAVGIAGINPHARIMVLKALNNFGHTRASYLAKAIVYAVDNSARIINLSVGGKEITTIEREAIKYATSKGVLVVVAAGNEGIDVSDYGMAALDGVVTVAATDLNSERALFSNWGTPVDIAAPGMEVLSLRARRTDFMRDLPDVEYVDGANYVGDDKRYYRASGTSFSAPIVTGVASLLLSNDPALTAQEVKRILLQSAEDIATPGVDQFTGHGMVDAKAALRADPAYYIDSGITGVEVSQVGGRTVVRVLGTADADRFQDARLELGEGELPQRWKEVGRLSLAVTGGNLGGIDASEFAGATQWTLRIVTRHQDGSTREARFQLDLE